MRFTDRRPEPQSGHPGVCALSSLEFKIFFGSHKAVIYK